MEPIDRIASDPPPVSAVLRTPPSRRTADRERRPPERREPPRPRAQEQRGAGDEDGEHVDVTA